MAAVPPRQVKGGGDPQGGRYRGARLRKPLLRQVPYDCTARRQMQKLTRTAGRGGEVGGAGDHHEPPCQTKQIPSWAHTHHNTSRRPPPSTSVGMDGRRTGGPSPGAAVKAVRCKYGRE